jgi:hypothetical protein
MKRDSERGDAATDPVARQEPKPQSEKRTEQRRDRRAEPPQREQRSEKRPEPQRREKEQRPPREDRGAPVQGFGDNAPAFLKRK